MTRRILRLAPVALVLAAWLAGCGTSASSPSSDGGVFVHIKSGPDQAHSVLMGLRMVQMMAEDRDVLVYFDVDGVKCVTADAPELKMEPFGSSRDLIADLAGRGVGLYACPGCLKAHSLTSERLMPGVKVANREAFFTFTEGRVITLDY